MYFDTQHAIEVHDMLIKRTGGLGGIKDQGLLESPLEHVQNDDYYPSFELKLTHLIFSIAKNHAFIDGNKRTALSLGVYFLSINGYPSWITSDFINKMEDIVVLIAADLIDKNDLGEYVSLIISENPFPNVLKLKLIKALTELEKIEGKI